MLAVVFSVFLKACTSCHLCGISMNLLSYYLTTVLLYGDEYTVTRTVSTTYYLTTLLLQVVLTEWSYIVLQVRKGGAILVAGERQR